MREELEQNLMDEFNFMIARNLWSGKKLDFAFPCECSDGWFDLIYNLCQEIQKVLDKESPEFIEGFYPVQIKEKFASLRYYTTYGNDEIFKLINEAEGKSEVTCEVCGVKGEVCIRGIWLRCLCEKCRDEQGYRDCRKRDEEII